MTLEDINRRGHYPADHEFKQLFSELVQKVFKLEEKVKTLEAAAGEQEDNWDLFGENLLPKEF